MLVSILIASILSPLVPTLPGPPGADTVVARIYVSTPRPGALPIDWVLLDTAGAVVERGSTPDEFERTFPHAPETLCAANPNDRVGVTLVAAARGFRVNGNAHCFRIAQQGNRLGIEAVLDPRAPAASR